MPRRIKKRRLRKRQGSSKLAKVGPSKALWNAAATGFGYASEARQALSHAKSMLRMAGQDKSSGKRKAVANRLLNADWTMNDSNGVKYKTVNVSYKASKRGKQTKALSQLGHTYYYTTGGQTSAVGAQGASAVGDLLCPELVTFHTNLNDEIALTANRANEKLYFEGSKDEIEFLNCSPTTMELDIYCLIDKTTQTIGNDPGAIWQDGINDESNNAATVPVESFSTPWMKPTSTKAFNINYWTKRYPVTLTAGEKCKFTYNFKRKRLLDTSYITNFTLIRGITHRIYVVQRGTLVDANNLKTFTAGNQSLSETKLVWVRKRTIYGSILSTLPKVVKQTGLNLPTILAGQWHIDEDTGEAEDAQVTTEFA